jgi:hypothetical protein
LARAREHVVAQVDGDEIREAQRGQRLAGGTGAGARVEHACGVAPRDVPGEHLGRQPVPEEADLLVIAVVGGGPVLVQAPQVVARPGPVGTRPDGLEARVMPAAARGRVSAGGGRRERSIGHGPPVSGMSSSGPGRVQKRRTKARARTGCPLCESGRGRYSL